MVGATGARQLLQDVDAPSNSTADNSANGTAAGPSVEEIKFKNCAFHPDTFEPDKTPRDVSPHPALNHSASVLRSVALVAA